MANRIGLTRSANAMHWQTTLHCSISQLSDLLRYGPEALQCLQYIAQTLTYPLAKSSYPVVKPRRIEADVTITRTDHSKFMIVSACVSDARLPCRSQKVPNLTASLRRIRTKQSSG